MVESQKQSTRHSVLLFLKRNGESEVSALAEHLGMTSVGVRKHLLQLRADGLAHARIERRPHGRPVSLYSLTETGEKQFPRDYASLASDVLSGLAALDGQAKVVEVLRRRRAKMTADYAPRMRGKNFKERVGEAAAILSEAGYMAETEATGQNAFLLTAHNCALQGVPKTFPYICDQEVCLIRDLVGGKVTRVSHTLAGDRHCIYRIEEEGKSPSHLPERE